nr:hypothetical protein [uncultured Clostridium sp.]
MKGDRIFGGCPSMPAGRVSSVKYAGNCKTTILEPVHAGKNWVDKNAVRFTNDRRQLVFVCIFYKIRTENYKTNIKEILLCVESLDIPDL